MKKLFLTSIGFFLAMTLLFAQQTTPEENATKVVTELVTKLTLNDEQKLLYHQLYWIKKSDSSCYPRYHNNS
ncbi:hypothetical protein KUH03_19020 [Sphingobacterium sp. E70]|uniref:hypothetical protein n=1 Tax=Sphingobacterium sp. E70 TaxID=2853439 RepID=UPI00211C147B|nr:hypothetical protein [Sphingobacterium sp. E70]ULT28453.1 hypothetical protein KUH03_19020 [Sphingobacterium sp. E70]